MIYSKDEIKIKQDDLIKTLKKEGAVILHQDEDIIGIKCAVLFEEILLRRDSKNIFKTTVGMEEDFGIENMESFNNIYNYSYNRNINTNFEAYGELNELDKNCRNNKYIEKKPTNIKNKRPKM